MFEEHERVEGIDIQRRPFPATVHIAGWIWLVIGTLILVHLLIAVPLTFSSFGRRGLVPDYQVGMSIGMCPSLTGILFLYFGIVTLRARVDDIIWNGIGSMFFSLLLFLFAVLILSVALAPDERTTPTELALVVAGFWFACGLGVVGAALLAFVGQASYRSWRQEERNLRLRQDEGPPQTSDRRRRPAAEE